MNILFIYQFFTKITIKVLNPHFCSKPICLIRVNWIGFSIICTGVELINLSILLVIMLVSIDKQEIAIFGSNGKLIYNHNSIITTVNQLHIRCGIDRTRSDRSIAERIANSFDIHPILSIFRGLNDNCTLHNIGVQFHVSHFLAFVVHEMPIILASVKHGIPIIIVERQIPIPNLIGLDTRFFTHSGYVAAEIKYSICISAASLLS